MQRMVAFGCSLLLSVGEVSVPASSRWAVVSRPVAGATPDGVRLYWVGLRNNANEARAFCLLGVTYSYELLDGTAVDQPTVEYPNVGSPHSCAPTMGHLVLAGETHFVKVQVALPKDVRRRIVKFRITAEETCAETDPCRHRPILVQ